MSCLPESLYAVYVDGELPREEVRRVEAHLVQCFDCRARVLALREEADLLGDVLRERERPRPRAAVEPEPAGGLALGFGTALGLAAVAAFATGWLTGERMPASLAWLHPLELLGAYEMVFDLIFWIRDEVPGLLELVVAAAATASASALLTFALTSLLRRVMGASTLAVALLCGIAPQAGAIDLRHDAEHVSIASGAVLEDTLVVSADGVDVDGVIEGDLFAFTERLALRGEVRGDVFVAAKEIDLSGVVTGSLHAVSRELRVSGEVRADAYSLCERTVLEPTGRIGRDATHFGEDVSIEGEVGRRLFAGAERLELRGAVARGVTAQVGDARIHESARVGGDLDVTLHDADEVDLAPGAAIAGEVRVARHEEGREPRWRERYGEGGFYFWLGIHLGGTFLVGMLLHLLVPGIFGGRLGSAGALFRTLGLGFLAAIATPVALVLVGLTLVGLPLALIGAAGYVAALYLAGILVAARVGGALVPPRGESWTAFGLPLLIGLLFVALATHLPFVGGLARLVVILTGLGLLVDRIREAFRQRGLAAG